MVRHVNDCCNCSSDGYPCIGDSCPRRNALEVECDKCGHLVDELWDYGGQELCEECLLKEIPKVRLE